MLVTVRARKGNECGQERLKDIKKSTGKLTVSKNRLDGSVVGLVGKKECDCHIFIRVTECKASESKQFQCDH